MNRHSLEKEDEKEEILKDICENRGRGDRRRRHSNGYTRLSIVGWICRREKSRRKDQDVHPRHSQ